MTTNLASLTEPEIRRALERAAKRQPIVVETEAGPGWVRADVQCLGTCRPHKFLAGSHDVFVWASGTVSCDCEFVKVVCYHIAAVLAATGGALPSAPPVVYTCARCGAAYTDRRLAAKHGRTHPITQFSTPTGSTSPPQSFSGTGPDPTPARESEGVAVTGDVRPPPEPK